MKNLKLKKIKGLNIINFLNERNYYFNIMTKDNDENDAQIDFNKIASHCSSLEEFKQALENLQIEEMMHSTYFSGYLNAFQYGELVKKLSYERIVNLVSVENLTYSIFLNDENGENIESFHDLQKYEIEFIIEKIKTSINKQLKKVKDIIDWVDNYNNFIDDFENESMFDIAEFIAQNDYFDYLHGLEITNADDLYLKEEQEKEFKELKSTIEKLKDFYKLKQELTSKQANTKTNKLKI